MSDTTAWDPSQPLRADATNEQIEARYEHVALSTYLLADLSLPACRARVARELADARVAAEYSGVRRAMATLEQVAQQRDHVMQTLLADAESRLAAVTAERDTLKREVEMLRLYGNKDCTAMADAALAAEEARRD